VIDGEAVCCDDAGVADFDKLHSRAYDTQVFLYAFDLLELDGEDWRPLEERKAKLQKLLAKAPAGIHHSGHLDGDGATIFAHACKLGLEGIVSKHREHPYRSGPSKAWLKNKNPDALGVLSPRRIRFSLGDECSRKSTGPTLRAPSSSIRPACQHPRGAKAGVLALKWGSDLITVRIMSCIRTV
jgi:ATP dependent DNA ligase domain